MGMTNREFGMEVGCSPTTASRMRNGKRAPSPTMLKRVVEAFKLDAATAVGAATSARAWGEYLRREVFPYPRRVDKPVSIIRWRPEDEPAAALVEGVK